MTRRRPRTSFGSLTRDERRRSVCRGGVDAAGVARQRDSREGAAARALELPADLFRGGSDVRARRPRGPRPADRLREGGHPSPRAHTGQAQGGPPRVAFGDEGRPRARLPDDPSARWRRRSRRGGGRSSRPPTPTACGTTPSASTTTPPTSSSRASSRTRKRSSPTGTTATRRRSPSRGSRRREAARGEVQALRDRRHVLAGSDRAADPPSSPGSQGLPAAAHSPRRPRLLRASRVRLGGGGLCRAPGPRPRGSRPSCCWPGRSSPRC